MAQAVDGWFPYVSSLVNLIEMTYVKWFNYTKFNSKAYIETKIKPKLKYIEIPFRCDCICRVKNEDLIKNLRLGSVRYLNFQ